MKLGLARSVACLGSRFRGLCYQLWNLWAAKLRVPVCVCVCVHTHTCVRARTLVRVCGLASRSSAETNALATQGWNFQPVFLYTHCWLWEARPELTILGLFFFFFFCFLAAVHGIPLVELHFQSFPWPMAFFKKGPKG